MGFEFIWIFLDLILSQCINKSLDHENVAMGIVRKEICSFIEWAQLLARVPINYCVIACELSFTIWLSIPIDSYYRWMRPF